MSTIRKSTPKAPVAQAAVVEVGPTPAQAAESAALVQANTAEFMVPNLLKPVTDLQEQVRAHAEKGAEQIKAQYEALKGKAELATGKLEESFSAASAGARAFNLKIFDLVRAQTNAGFAHIEALASAKTFGEAIQLNQEFAKAQAEALQAHSKDLAEFTTKLATNVAEPARASVVLPFAR